MYKSIDANYNKYIIDNFFLYMNNLAAKSILYVGLAFISMITINGPQTET